MPQLYRHAQALIDFRRDNPAVPFLDLYYKNLKHDPIAVIQQFYDFVDENLTPEVATVMQHYLHKNPEQPFGKHSYLLEDFVEDVDEIAEKFSTYRRQYAIETQ